MARLGVAGRGKARPGLFTAGCSLETVSFPVETPARLGVAWRGQARQGMARQGLFIAASAKVLASVCRSTNEGECQ